VPEIIPFLQPLPPDLMELAFNYMLAVDAGDDDTVTELAVKIRPYPWLMAAVAEGIVFPVTALSDNTDDLNADSFVLDELGVIFLMAIREWSYLCPGTAARAIASCIAHFTAQVLADEPHNVTHTLETMRDEHMARAAGQALAGTDTHSRPRCAPSLVSPTSGLPVARIRPATIRRPSALNAMVSDDAFADSNKVPRTESRSPARS